MRPAFILSLAASTLAALLILSCSSSEVQVALSAEARFDRGMKKFADGDYLEAISEFEIVKLQFPGSGVADKAQYYLAQSRFKREEYLLAAQEYQTLQRNMPASPLVPLAMYDVGLCYYMLSPSRALDQTYTLKAIDELQAFIEYNPKHELVKDAEEKIQELNTRLAGRMYDIADLYMKMDDYLAATIYYEQLIEKYHDTRYAEPALLGKVRALVARKHYDEAKTDLDKFFEKYPDSTLKRDAESLRTEIDNHLKTKSAVMGIGRDLDRPRNNA